MYICLRIIILLICIKLAIEDYRSHEISTKGLIICSIIQFVSGFFITEGNYFLIKAIIALSLMLLLFSKNIKNKIGEADIIFLSAEIFSLNLKNFAIFWFTSLFLAAFYGIFNYIIKREREIPMFPFFVAGDLFALILGGLNFG